ncbi:MAG: hypothetical protein U9Q98_03930 [Bacteroidota bacterium]|nr:hypothetical protein [Bacteroidota bacterium]
MRKLIAFLLFIASINAYCSETIKIDKKYNADDVIDLTSYHFKIYGIQLFGDVDLSTESSLVRTVFFSTGNEIAMLNEFYYPLYLNGQYQLNVTEENVFWKMVFIQKKLEYILMTQHCNLIPLDCLKAKKN